MSTNLATISSPNTIQSHRLLRRVGFSSLVACCAPGSSGAEDVLDPLSCGAPQFGHADALSLIFRPHSPHWVSAIPFVFLITGSPQCISVTQFVSM